MCDLRLQSPFSWLVAGGSGCGKTTKVLHFLKHHKIMTTNPHCENIIYYYNQWQDQFEKFKDENIVSSWIQGCPTLSEIKEQTYHHKEKGSIIVIDDFAHILGKDVLELFTVYSHHGNCSTIFLSQNLFDKNPIFRQISLNSSYISIFKNPRDKQQIRLFAKQIEPTNHKFIIDSYMEATKKPYSYLFFDNRQTTPDQLRVRSCILPHEQPMIAWLKK
jgi:Cdc6-like AAA superfamily ATPase